MNKETMLKRTYNVISIFVFILALVTNCFSKDMYYLDEKKSRLPRFKEGKHVTEQMRCFVEKKGVQIKYLDIACLRYR